MDEGQIRPLEYTEPAQAATTFTWASLLQQGFVIVVLSVEGWVKMKMILIIRPTPAQIIAGYCRIKSGGGLSTRPGSKKFKKPILVQVFDQVGRGGCQWGLLEIFSGRQPPK